jgi:hypothetical protein
MTAARTFARILTAMVVFELAVALYVLIFGGVRIDLGPWRLSAGTWRHPLTQAIVLGLVAAWLYARDAAARGEWDVVPRLVRRAMSRAIAPLRAEPFLWSGVLVAIVAAVVVCDRLAAQRLVIGSEAGGWAYPYVRGVPPETAAIVLLHAVVLGALLWWRGRRSAPGEWVEVGLWLVAAMGLQLLLRSLTPFSFEQIFLSEGANSFYTVTQQHDAASVLSRFAEVRGSWPLHAHSNMPGKLMLLYGLELVSNDPVTLSLLLIGLSNLGGVLLYLFVRDLFGDRRVALYALALYLFVPARLFFLPLMNTVTPVVAFTCLLLFERWLQRASPRYAVAAGVALYALIFFEPIPLVSGALVALLAARALRRRDITPAQFLRAQGGLVVLSFIATMTAVWMLSGFNLADGVLRVGADAAAFNAAETRPYGLWTWRNLVEFFVGAGICQAVLFVVALAEGLRRVGEAPPLIDRPIVLLSAGLMVMLLVLDLAGVSRGETIRLWIFLACLLQIPAAWVCARLNSRLALTIVLVLSVVQSAIGTATIGFVVP